MRDPVLIIPDEAQKNHIFLCGSTGEGKSNTCRTIIEYNLWKGRRVCVIDPNGDHWGLKSDASGNKAGFPVVVFGGDHADVEIDDTMGARIGEILATTNTPAVIDLQRFSPERMAKFLTPFFEVAYRLNRSPWHMVLDEAHKYAPQRPRPDQARLIHQVTDLVTGGRSRGFRLMIVTQRPAKISKDPIAMARAFILHGVTSAHDRKALRDMLEDVEDGDDVRNILGSLPKMPVGEAWIWIPKSGVLERKKFPLGVTFDSGAAPEDGEVKTDPTKLAHIDVDKIKALLQPKPKEKKGIKFVPTDFGKQTPAHDQVLTAYERGLKDARAENEAEKNRLTREFNKAFAAQAKEYDKRVSALRRLTQHLVTATGAAADVAKELLDKLNEEPAEGRFTAEQVIRDVGNSSGAKRTAAPRPERINVASVADHTLPGPEAKIMGAIAFWIAAGIIEPTRVQVGVVSGYSPRSSTFDTYVRRLKAKDFISYPAPGTMALTDIGITFVSVPAMPSNADLHAKIAGVIGGPEMKLLKEIMEAYPHPISREDVGRQSGYSPSSSTFDTYVRRIKALDLVSYPSPGMILASDWLFPEGS